MDLKGVTMNRVILALSMAILLVTGASGQDVKPFSLYVGGGLSVFASPNEFKDAYKTGFHGSGGLGFNVAPMFQVIARVEYHTFSMKEMTSPLIPPGSFLEGGTFSALMIGGDAKLSPSMPGSPFKPYVLGGVGIATIKTADVTVTGLPYGPSVSDTKLYVNFGGGLEFKAGLTLALFVQGRYVLISTEGDSISYIPITVGLKF
jgi:opacity protein-like surface antigen